MRTERNSSGSDSDEQEDESNVSLGFRTLARKDTSDKLVTLSIVFQEITQKT